MPKDPRVTLVYPPGDTARAIREALSAEGIATEATGNVFRAVSTFTAEPSDLVLLGLAHLDERDLDAIHVFREIRPDVFVIALFPLDRRETAVRALASGADAYLLEPFYMGELLSMVRRGLSRSTRSDDIEQAQGTGLEQLAGGIAHAVNNSLQIIELLLADSGQKGPNVAELRRETHRINEVVAELLAFSRRGDHRPEQVDINSLIENRVPAPKRKRRRIELALAPDLPELRGDERSLGFVLDSLIGLQTAREGLNRLVLSTEMEEGNGLMRVSIRFAVPDLVLTSEECSEVFQPFRGPLAGAVGLAGVTVHSVVSAHEGSVNVMSSEGEGTIVSVALPAGAARPVREE